MPIDETVERLIRIESKIDTLIQKMMSPDVVAVAEQFVATQDASILGQFTAKQHCAIQMIMEGHKNTEIAKRLGITENTAKVHVRTIAKKLGVKTRGQIVAKLMQAYDACDDSQYQAMAHGLPKDWSRTYKKPDKFKSLYRSK